MPYIYMGLSQKERVERPVGGVEAALGTVVHAVWESAAGARYFILWDGSAVARRYTAEQLQEQGIRKVSESVETGDNRRIGG